MCMDGLRMVHPSEHRHFTASRAGFLLEELSIDSAQIEAVRPSCVFIVIRPKNESIAEVGSAEVGSPQVGVPEIDSQQV